MGLIIPKKGQEYNPLPKDIKSSFSTFLCVQDEFNISRNPRDNAADAVGLMSQITGSAAFLLSEKENCDRIK